MNAIELYKFIDDYNIEWHYQENDGREDVIIFPYVFHIEIFTKLLSPNVFNNGGIECTLMDGYFAFWMKDLCDNCGIELSEVFNKELDE